MDRAQLKSGDQIRRYVTAGKAIFTLFNPSTGRRFTYRATAMKSGKGHFISLLSGPDNTSSYQYMGCLWADTKRFTLTRKSRITKDALSYKAFAWLVKKVFEDGYDLPAPAEIWHEGRCGRCGRRLTVPESIATGIGPVCQGRSN
jgi:hypothetical protein